MNDYWADKAANLEAIQIPAYVGTDTTCDLHRMGTFEGFRRLGICAEVASGQQSSRMDGPVRSRQSDRFAAFL